MRHSAIWGYVRQQCGELGYFGDARRAAVGTTLIERVMETGSLVVRKLGSDRAGEMAIHRFLAAPSVATVEIVETLAARTAVACAGRRIVVAQDTTEINFAGREERRRGLGPAGDGISAGFFIHPLIAIDSETGAVLGLVGARIWTRTDEIAPTQARALEDKESIRWLEGADCAAACLADAASVVVVADREGDIYASFARRPEEVDLIVRAAQDRALHDGKRLFTAPAAWPELARAEVRVVPSRAGGRARITTVVLRAGPVVISRPRHGGDRSDPPQLTLHMVEAREINAPADAQPLLWRLLTTLPVASAADAQEIVRLYRLRWRIDIYQSWRLSRFCWDGVNRRAWGGSRLRRRDRRWPAAPRSWRSANLPDRRDHRRIGVYQNKLAISINNNASTQTALSYPVVKSWLWHRDVPGQLSNCPLI